MKKILIDKYNQHKNNVLEDGGESLHHNVIEDSSKLKTCCFYNDKNRKYDSSRTELQNKVRESDLEGLPDHLLEQSSTNNNEISSVKNIFKIGTPFR